MRILIDLQGAQAASANRGIGRYSLSLAKAIADKRGHHEVLIALNGLFPKTIEPVRAAFDTLLPQENIRIWHAPGPVCGLDPANDWRRNSAELLREAFLSRLQPDVVHISSLFEGVSDDGVTSIGRFSPTPLTTVSLYDLIPYIHRGPYFADPAVKSWYYNKLGQLQHANILLAISESSRQEGIDHLGFPTEQVVNVSTAADEHFRPLQIDIEEEQRLRQKYALTRPFLMYTGGIDYRKNIEGLIRAFALLPLELRQMHQLAIICSVQPEQRQALEQLARQQGLGQDEMRLTGFVSEEDLVALYNLCKLFVFPSRHEGFGLPALEAMCCEAPVIGSNSSSLPEVIGREDALFDPDSDQAIAAKIVQVLTDDDFRLDLIKNSKLQAQQFSWDESARRAVAAFEQLQAEKRKGGKPKLAYVSPLPPERSGIADYSAELLPELARYYDIEVIVAQQEVADDRVKACCPIRSVDQFVKHAKRYERVLYHFGNSPYHQHMFDLLQRIPGVVVLHDFFLGNIQSHREQQIDLPFLWIRELYRSHGYAAVQERFHATETDQLAAKYPCNFSVLQRATGIIVHSAYSTRLANRWYRQGIADDWAVIPLLRVPAPQIDRRSVRHKLDLPQDDLIFCSFGMLGLTKQNHRLLKAWLNSSLVDDSRCRLLFVGENVGGEYEKKMLDTITQSGKKDQIQITGWVAADEYQEYLAAADVAVQLRTLSRGETSAAVLDCMNHALPTIINANGALADLPAEAVWMLADEFEDAQLVDALEQLRQDPVKREQLGARARELVLTRHAPTACTEQYRRAIEAFHAGAQTDMHGVVKAIAGLGQAHAYGDVGTRSNGGAIAGAYRDVGTRSNAGAIAGSEEDEMCALAADIVKTLPPKQPARQLFIDISELAQRDAMSGIQRVVRSILKRLLLSPPAGYRVEPVYATLDQPGYRYARNFTLRFIDAAADWLDDSFIEMQAGDLFLGLDLQSHVISAQSDYLTEFRARGGEVLFVVYDLLPVLLPHAFIQGGEAGHAAWLRTVSGFDGAVCISRTVADELVQWLKHNGAARQRPFKIGWFHLGADVENSIPTSGMPDNARQLLSQLSARHTFMMVGTLEPRKEHAQVLAALEQLWADGQDLNLLIIGKPGWMVEPLIERLRNHAERDKRLFWLEGVSDEFLEKLYAASTCLIAASAGEGFGLPLIEAAQHKLPVIARDIPVFREVAGEHAFYFQGQEAVGLADALRNWLTLFESGNHPPSDSMPWLTWQQSSEQLKKVIFEDEWYAQ